MKPNLSKEDNKKWQYSLHKKHTNISEIITKSPTDTYETQIFDTTTRRKTNIYNNTHGISNNDSNKKQTPICSYR